ncbi:MAG: hypothetical protein LBH69_05805 [Methanomassiliicoccaceae archaeon]|jgi:hypothetical protein|nr:hypothetical protein [Methanomassiliicoccaceae archaeon]
MAIFGLTDPFIIAAYVGCFLCVVIAWGFALFKKHKDTGKEDEGDE